MTKRTVVVSQVSLAARVKPACRGSWPTLRGVAAGACSFLVAGAAAAGICAHGVRPDLTYGALALLFATALVGALVLPVLTTIESAKGMRGSR